MERRTESYETYLHERLCDPSSAAEYLNAALEENDPAIFLLALRDIAEARGVSKVAAEANLNRESMYRILSRKGNPCLSSLVAIFSALGLKLAVEEETQAGEYAEMPSEFDMPRMADVSNSRPVFPRLTGCIFNSRQENYYEPELESLAA